MFKITKHYFDGIDQSGNAFILYAAKLKILFLNIPFSSILFSDEQDQVYEHSSLKKADVDFSLNQANISSLNSNILGEWKDSEKSIQENLLEEKNKHLHWNCRIPKATFTIQYQEKIFKGLGYCETLTMNFAPWKLPITILKWGRFLSENHHIVWIEWIGKHPLKKVFWNGEKIEHAEISDSRIVFHEHNAQLTFENPVVIKEERLSNLADRFPFVKLFFKEKFLESMESKYKSASTFSFNHQTEKGYSLYETVLWKK